MDKLSFARRKFLKGALGTAAAGAALSKGIGSAVWAQPPQNPFAPPPLEQLGLDLPGPGGLLARDIHQTGYWPVPALPPASGVLEAQQVGPNAHVITGSGINVLVVTTNGGAILVDGGREEYSPALLQLVQSLPNSGPVHTLFNTSARIETRGANLAVGEAGGRIISHEMVRQWQAIELIYPWDPANVFSPLPPQARANDVFRATNNAAQNIVIGSGNNEVQVQYGRLPFAHTDSSIYVYFPQSNVVAIGGITNGPNSAWSQIEYRGNWPEIDWRLIGRSNQHHGALNAVADRIQEDTVVVPAQGGLLTQANLRAHAAMLQEITGNPTPVPGGMGNASSINSATVWNPGTATRHETLYAFLNAENRQAYIAEWGDPTVFVYRGIESSWFSSSVDA